MTYLKEARKALVAVAGVVAQIVALNVLPANVEKYGVAVLAVLTALGVYVVPNATTPTA